MMDSSTIPVSFYEYNGSMRNNSDNRSTERFAEDPIYIPAVQSMFCVMYTVIFVLGMFGNLLTCYVVCRNRDMQTVTNFFITNLALSDILLCTLSIPFTPIYTFSGKWAFGMVMCHLVSFSQGTSVYVSTLTLTSIAVDRFFVIIYPFRRRMKTQTCIYIICCTWMISILAILPYGYFVKHEAKDEFMDDYVCEELWPSQTFRKAYGGVTFTLQFVIPFLIIAVCYIKISVKLNDRTKARPGVSNPRREEVERTRKQRTNRMLIAMVFIFGMCWLPLNCVNVVDDFTDSATTGHYHNVCFFLFHVIAMSSTCYNPFLYSWLNENFRKEFKQVLPGFRRPSHPSERTCNGNETVADSLLTSMSVVRRSSSVRDRRNDKFPENVKVKYNTEEERVSVGTDESALLKQGDSNRSSPPGERADSIGMTVFGSEQGQLV